MYYIICENCGAVLDPGETCDCETRETFSQDQDTIKERRARALLEKIDRMQREYEFRKTYCREKCEKWREVIK